MTKLWPGVVLLAALSACAAPSGPSAERLPKRTFQYWLDHPEERAEVLVECRESAAAEAQHNARFRAHWKLDAQQKEDSSWLVLSPQ